MEKIFFMGFFGVWVVRGASLSSVVSSAGDMLRGVFWSDSASIALLFLGDW